MTTTIAAPEQASTEQREQFLAFVADPETYAVVDQVIGEMMLPTPRSARAPSRMRSSTSASSARPSSWWSI